MKPRKEKLTAEQRSQRIGFYFLNIMVSGNLDLRKQEFVAPKITIELESDLSVENTVSTVFRVSS
jgi:hypothetical protein